MPQRRLEWQSTRPALPLAAHLPQVLRQRALQPLVLQPRVLQLLAQRPARGLQE